MTLDTDHFGFNLDLDVGSKHLWVGAPKGVSPLNDNEVPGTLHTCDLNIRNPGSCKTLPDTVVSGNEDVNGQLYGISVSTVNSKAKGTTEVDVLSSGTAQSFAQSYIDISCSNYRSANHVTCFLPCNTCVICINVILNCL